MSSGSLSRTVGTSIGPFSILLPSQHQNAALNDNISESSSISSTASGTWSPPSLAAATDSTDLVVSVDLSDSELTIKLGSNPFLDLPPLLLRKKSGELVKLSLKLPTLAKCKSALLIPMKKSVSFALRLENIKMFDGADSPSTLSTTENSPISSPRNGKSLYFSWDWDHSSSSYNEPVDDGYDYLTSDDEEVARKSWKIESSDVAFVEPSCLYKEKRPVLLQLIAVAADKKTLFGFILCKNLAFEKHLNIKLTTNSWKSSIIISNASYVQSFKSTNYDQFKFLMPLLNYRSFIGLELVVKYTVSSETYWDNNNGKNYHINLKTVQPVISHKNSIPEFEDLVNRLVNVKQEIDGTDKSFIPRLRSSFGRYNFELEDLPLRSTNTGSSRSPIPARPALKSSFSNSDVANMRPRYSNSFRNKNIPGKQGLLTPKSSPLKTAIVPPESPKLPYTSSYPPATAVESNTRPAFIDLAVANTADSSQRESFNSKSYTDLVNAYCFYKGETSQTESTPNSHSLESGETKSKSASSLFSGLHPAIPASAASTFHSFSDSIHI